MPSPSQERASVMVGRILLAGGPVHHPSASRPQTPWNLPLQGRCPPGGDGLLHQLDRNPVCPRLEFAAHTHTHIEPFASEHGAAHVGRAPDQPEARRSTADRILLFARFSAPLPRLPEPMAVNTARGILHATLRAAHEHAVQRDAPRRRGGGGGRGSGGGRELCLGSDGRQSYAHRHYERKSTAPEKPLRHTGPTLSQTGLPRQPYGERRGTRGTRSRGEQRNDPCPTHGQERAGNPSTARGATPCEQALSEAPREESEALRARRPRLEDEVHCRAEAPRADTPASAPSQTGPRRPEGAARERATPTTGPGRDRPEEHGRKREHGVEPARGNATRPGDRPANLAEHLQGQGAPEAGDGVSGLGSVRRDEGCDAVCRSRQDLARGWQPEPTTLASATPRARGRGPGRRAARTGHEQPGGGGCQDCRKAF